MWRVNMNTEGFKTSEVAQLNIINLRYYFKIISAFWVIYR